MKTRLLLICILVSAVCAAQAPSGLVSYEVSAPESATQGEWISVVYTLEATNFSVGDFEDSPGLLLETVNQYKTDLDGGVRRFTLRCLFSVTAIGTLELPRLNATVDGVPIQAAPTLVNALPNPRYGEEWQIAMDFLKARGVPPSHLEARYSGETLYAFSDQGMKVFAIVVAGDYRNYIENPVLAYGIGDSMWDGSAGSGDNTIYHLIGRYNAMLHLLKEKGQVYHSLPSALYSSRPEGVAPLLGDIRYGQRYPYNEYFPHEKFNGRDSLCLVGCGPVALAQVLACHKSSTPPKGSAIIKTESGREIGVEMQDNPFNWNGSEHSLASLMLCAAASVGAVVAPDGTSSSLVNFKGALLNNWGYSPSCTYVPKYNDMAMLSMVYKDLNEGRPVIVADAAHIFVCDGYFEDFLHFNLGWNGYCNGYYRAIVIPSDKRRQLPFNELLAGIKPMPPGGGASLKLTVKKPGQLASVLEKARKKMKKKLRDREITSLKITGKIGGTDILLLRQLAGAVPMQRYEQPHGSLMDLDLSEATLVPGAYYVTRPMGKMIISGVTATGAPYRYDMSRLSPSQWAEMQALGLTEGDTWTIQPDGAGGYCMSWKVVAGTIGQYMFSDCQNLRTLVLPMDTKVVAGSAFFGARALRRVLNLPAKVASDAFENSGIAR